MTRIPSCAFRCIVTRQLANGQRQIEQSNHESLFKAWGFRNEALKKASTRKVEVVVVIDESTPVHCGDDLPHSTIRAYRDERERHG